MLISSEGWILCSFGLDRGGATKLIVEKLEEFSTPFIDVGMGVELVGESLIGVLRITTSTAKQREHVRLKDRIPFSDGDGDNEYSRNIQIADLNAVLAVIKWKKLFGFYLDLEKEHYSTYTIDGNTLTNRYGQRRSHQAKISYEAGDDPHP